MTLEHYAPNHVAYVVSVEKEMDLFQYSGWKNNMSNQCKIMNSYPCHQVLITFVPNEHVNGTGSQTLMTGDIIQGKMEIVNFAKQNAVKIFTVELQNVEGATAAGGSWANAQ